MLPIQTRPAHIVADVDPQLFSMTHRTHDCACLASILPEHAPHDGVERRIGRFPRRSKRDRHSKRLGSHPTLGFPRIACVIERAIEVERRLEPREQFRPERRAIVDAPQLDAQRMLPEPSLDAVCAPPECPGNVVDGQRRGTPLVEGTGHAWAGGPRRTLHRRGGVCLLPWIVDFGSAPRPLFVEC